VAVTDLSEEPTYDAALSFAGEDRDFVKEVAEELKRRGIRIFIDEDNAATMWGEDLYTFLDNVYRRQSRFVIIFVSKHYVAKPWTNHERQSAQAKALLEKGAYILPVRLDDSELPGLRPTISYLNGRIGPKALADALQVKLGGPIYSIRRCNFSITGRFREPLRTLGCSFEPSRMAGNIFCMEEYYCRALKHWKNASETTRFVLPNRQVFVCTRILQCSTCGTRCRAV
jgi:TIR domain